MIQTLFHGLMKNMRMAQSCPDRLETVHADDDMLFSEARPRSASEDLAATPASWDTKRETCANCKHIYLKFLSPAAGFCSLDCKANANYIAEVRTLPKTTSTDEEHVVSFKPISIHVPETPAMSMHATTEVDDDDMYYAESFDGPHTFSDFHTEKLAARAVEWSFSALY
ncbi:hypothetical protein SPRG_05167 [Saprolegnia parasitica CBS 223.65]|uniref:Uncharacterized protein n=1 Tax=Saprolegnia parasitica (strain CBS 223.65) TaxID=695850 RepID=A0A067CHI2_SAPPC|nr:hypothetical protein SPRG_05167 [Saprolegnia parasitica CBS 223.65]KDO29978.1 hypothetical protein SPRG_05167 [Saprolegnia parasitica CBS 223.65]|eukprot:XP_012199161.1 hypothetical protein SPRG_05167 [Saprolegnia parasitica CBS 223.65]